MQYLTPSIQFYMVLLLTGVIVFFLSRLLLMRKITNKATLNTACALIAVFVMASGYFAMVFYIYSQFSGRHY